MLEKLRFNQFGCRTICRHGIENFRSRGRVGRTRWSCVCALAAGFIGSLLFLIPGWAKSEILGNSFNQLVGAGEQRVWHSDTNGLSGFEIDDQLELGRLLDGQIGGLNTLENFINVTRGTPV
jgi:hypothetical protein